jgi:hypothetical protein
MFRSAIQRTIPIVAMSVWLVQPSAAAPAPTKSYQVTVERRSGCPVEIVEAVVLVRPSRSEVLSSTEETTYDVTLRNASGKRVIHVGLHWTALADGNRPMQDEIVSYIPDKDFKPNRAWRRVTPAPDPAVEVDRFTVTVAEVRFADRTVWPGVEPRAGIREAAESGDPQAQYELGLNYRDGRDAALDPVTAYAWLHLSALGGHGQARESRDELAATLTPEQIDEALRIARSWGVIQFNELFE